MSLCKSSIAKVARPNARPIVVFVFPISPPATPETKERIPAKVPRASGEYGQRAETLDSRSIYLASQVKKIGLRFGQTKLGETNLQIIWRMICRIIWQIIWRIPRELPPGPRAEGRCPRELPTGLPTRPPHEASPRGLPTTTKFWTKIWSNKSLIHPTKFTGAAHEDSPRGLPTTTKLRHKPPEWHPKARPPSPKKLQFIERYSKK